jgi:hypothetical protein
MLKVTAHSSIFTRQQNLTQFNNQPGNKQRANWLGYSYLGLEEQAPATKHGSSSSQRLPENADSWPDLDGKLTRGTYICWWEQNRDQRTSNHLPIGPRTTEKYRDPLWGPLRAPRITKRHWDTSMNHQTLSYRDATEKPTEKTENHQESSGTKQKHLRYCWSHRDVIENPLRSFETNETKLPRSWLWYTTIRCTIESNKYVESRE